MDTVGDSREDRPGLGRAAALGQEEGWLLPQGSPSNSLSSVPQFDQYQDRWTQSPHSGLCREITSLSQHLLQLSGLSRSALSLNWLHLSPPVFEASFEPVSLSLPCLSSSWSRSPSSAPSQYLSVSVTSMSLCLHLSLSPPPESPSPPYLSVPLVSVFLSLYLPRSAGAPSCLLLCPVSPFLSLAVSSAMFPSISLSPSVSPSPPLCLCLSAPAFPHSPPPPPRLFRLWGPDGGTFTLQCLRAEGRGSFWDFSPPPAPGPSRQQPLICLVCWGLPLTPRGSASIGKNSSLEQTLCHP